MNVLLTKPFRPLILAAAMLVSVFLVSPRAEAKPPDFNGGVLNEYTYEEVFFLTGQPVTFKGKATVSEKESNNQLTSTYRFTLDGPNGAKLTRSVVFVADLEKREDKGQTTSNSAIKSFTEKVTLGDKTSYTLDDYQFSQGTVIDNRPASDYYSGNIVGRKIYKVKQGTSKEEKLVTVHFTGRNMGYENFWGATETQLIDYEIVMPNGQSGFVTSKVADSKTKRLQYEPHDPSLSSFTGGHAVVSESNMIGEYTYNLPYGGGTGKIKLSQERTPKIERLIVPKFRDLNSHWAKDHIEKLYSLGVFDESTQFFSPNTPMKRYQYTVGILKAVDIRVLEDPKSKKKVAKTSIFKDVSAKDPDYLYIESAVQKGIVTGVTPDTFNPNGPITRVQAVAILVRALGMEGRAPSPGFKTHYADDRKIADWAKDSVYVATELGLISGDQFNRFNPNEPLTRAQAAKLTDRFLDFLENDLKQNYRDDVFFFN
ncbi:S-layer homology domain-containing protein [Sporosarcina sp. Te-1]|uniref:S-layer homology domain-containing protein n=1 Tax=Sporosarcina sp. Te-1 TaxID=2818390 RepID=UPI001A9F5EB9|nr:S-layer homology domain-containing protein [Sporosarcina sp. Te-1]QTD41071.1 S-layer homology domain-containing protein [Sporosarcina sp. Te-1]